MLDGLIRLLEWVGDKWRDYISPFCIIRDYEGGVLMRLGHYKHNLKKGINWKLPIIDEVHTVLISIDTFHIANINVTTTDGKMISIGAIVEFEITDVKKYLIDMNDASSNSHDMARGIIADYVTDCTLEEVKDKKTLTKIKNKLKNEFDDLGINVRKLLFGDIIVTKALTIFKD